MNPNPIPEGEERHGEHSRVSSGGEGEEVTVDGVRVGDDGCEGEAAAQRRHEPKHEKRA